MNYSATSFARLLLLAALLNCLTQTIHEAGHWAIYQAYGRQPVWGFIGLVQIWDRTPLNPDKWVETVSATGEHGWLRLASAPSSAAEQVIASVAGPMASLLGVIAGLILARSPMQFRWKQTGLMLALTGASVEVLYYLRSPFRVGGDEFLIAAQLGVSKMAIEIPFALAFAVCLIFGLRESDSWRTRLKWIAAILLGSVPTGLLLMMADGIVRSQVDQGHPLFQPVLGFSLPVIVFNALALLLLWRQSVRPLRQL